MAENLLSTPALSSAQDVPGASASPDDHLLTFVRDRDVTCPLCGYNLRALTVPRCPECGQALKLTVGLVDLNLKSWLACTIATTLSAGMGLLALFVTLRDSGGPHLRSDLEAISFYSFPPMILVAAAFLLGRRWFHHLSRAGQSRLAFYTVFFVVLQFAVFFCWIR